MAPFFFDIETGGLKKDSSIVSISFGRDPTKVQSLYAEPAKGTFLSRWSEKNVWEPIKKLQDIQIESEETVLKKFLQKLPEKGEIAGWNVGYRGTSRGFDIPKLFERAEKYGLGAEYQKAFSNLRVRDIGQEFAYKMAKEVSGYEHLVEQGKLSPNIFESATAYAELGRKYEVGRIATERQASRFLAE